MYSERYQLFSRGRLLKGASKHNYLAYLNNKLGLDSNKADLLCNEKVVIIKNNLLWEEVNKYYQLFKKSGLNVGVQVVMNSESFISALTSNHDNIKTQTTDNIQKKNTKPLQLLCDLRKLKPLIYAPKTILNVTDLNKSTLYELNGKSISFGTLFLLAIVIFVSLNLQRYFVQLLTYNYGLVMTSTIIGISSLVICLIYLPILLPPLRNLEITRQNNSNVRYSYREIKNINLKEIKYYFSIDDDIASQIIRNRYNGFNTVCISDTGLVEYFVTNKEEEINEQAGEASKEVSSYLSGLSILDYIEYFSAILKYLKNLSQEPSIENMNQFSFIYNEKHSLVATTYISSHLLIEFEDANIPEDEKIKVISTALISAGVN